MKKIHVSLAVTGILVLSLGAKTPPGKVQICHHPPDNPDHVQIISISENALADHLAHGDHRSFGDYCYVVVAGDVHADTSEASCDAQFGGHLASIHSQDEDDFISELLQLLPPVGPCAPRARIGGDPSQDFCSGPSETYGWTDGSPWNFSNWRLSTGEPSCSSGAGMPASIQFWPDSCGTLSGWNDVKADAQLGFFVCKYEP